MFTLADGSVEVVDECSTRRAIVNLCRIRARVAIQCMRQEPGHVFRQNPTKADIASYEIEGMAVKQCHDILREQLRDVLRDHHRQRELCGEAKKPFNERASCASLQTDLSIFSRGPQLRFPSGWGLAIRAEPLAAGNGPNLGWPRQR